MSLVEADELVQLLGVTVQFQLAKSITQRQRPNVVAVDDVNLSIRRGQSLGLVGATGSGKSTIAHLVMGMVEPTSGTVRVGGSELGSKGVDRRALRRIVQVVLQDPYSSLDPRMKVGDIIAEPLTVGRPRFGRDRRTEIDKRVAALLELVGLRANRARRFPHEFSGGQRQRIAIARALAPRPELIVLDEPTSALDVSVRAQILTLLKRLQTELGVTYLVISHDLITVAYLADEVAVMHLGRMVETGPTRELFKSPRHPYTLELLDSAPGASGAFLNQPRPTGVSATSLPPTACRYAYRCALRLQLGSPARCLEEDPDLTPPGERHEAACHFSDELGSFAQEAAASSDALLGTEPRPASRAHDA